MEVAKLYYSGLTAGAKRGREERGTKGIQFSPFFISYAVRPSGGKGDAWACL